MSRNEFKLLHLLAEKVVDEIKRLKVAIYKTNSEHLIKDYSKQTVKLIKELKSYCKYKKLNFTEVMKGVK